MDASTEKNSPDTFAGRLLILMRERNLKQPGLAEALHIAQGTVSGWLSGATPQRRSVKDLAEFFEVSEGWLLNGGQRVNIRTDTGRAHDMDPSHNIYSDLETETLKKMLADVSRKLLTATGADCKYKLGQMQSIIDELQSREMVGEIAKEMAQRGIAAGDKKEVSSKSPVDDYADEIRRRHSRKEGSSK